MRVNTPKDTPITLIGAAGALGSGVRKYIQENGFTNVAICDLQYNDKPTKDLPEGWRVLPAESGKFTDACLARSGQGSWLITTAYGDEMLHSNWKELKAGTTWIGAQNKDIPEREQGVSFARALKGRGITHLPGQLMTIGGTTASWIEWQARRSNTPFSKAAAHDVVHNVTQSILEKMMEMSHSNNITPYEAMLEYAHKSHWEDKDKTTSLTHAERLNSSKAIAQAR